MNKFLIIIALTSFLGCKNTPIKKQEQFEMKFAPSFIPYLHFNLKMENDSGKITYYVVQPRNPLTGLPNKTIVNDSLVVKVEGETYLNFAKTIREIDFKSYEMEEMDMYGIDGINLYFKYVSAASDTSQTNFESIKRRNPKVALKLVKNFFEFIEIVFKNNKKQLDYLGSLKEYFDYKSMNKNHQ